MKDLNLLYVFEAMWRDRSVTVSAERLGLTQAAVSGSLKRIREEYDDKMFTLVGRRMEPTPLAVELAPQLLDALALVRKTRVERGRFDPAIARRMFTVRTRDIGEVVCLPRILAALGQSAPGLRLRTLFRPIPETMSGMAAGQIDFALGFLPTLETGIHSRLLFRQHYVCVMREGHPLAGVKLTSKRFAESEHLLVEYSGSGHAVLERALVDAGARHRITVRLPQYLAAPHFVIGSDLLWSVPAMLAETLQAHYRLVIKPHPLSLPEFEVALYWHDRYHRDPANKWLRDFIVHQFAVDSGAAP
ncbi:MULTISPECIES: LysR family transcriptional regulator [unclassified Variovorax]|uniref:LysR family transcriptional regulator n=1 Tax=unclassified Variovorax TaxID=663243 RepID=UPI0025778C53|nr:MULTISPECIES: LysR family transcriptional regulator [unclassified Variovorax]MDM0066950.1 LysR family transcriptional regulator [Variovorax sp. J31P207]MDM0084647.1 LysR family transcriptional regulator [Variovorax sp. J31P179]